MCFSVNVNLVRDEIQNRFGAHFPDRDRYDPSYYYHAFGLPELPAVCSETPQLISLLRWGLIPSWTRTSEDAEEIRYKTFNARAETISTKPSFASSFKSRRCLIPVMGFYEWQHSGNNKIPWYIYRSDNSIMILAGIYDEWVESRTGAVLNTFSVVTTDANNIMAEIHNTKKRMPVILDIHGEVVWINNDSSDEERKELLKPCPDEFIKAHTISDLVNNKSANRNTPDIIKPYSRPTENLLF